MPEPKRPLKVFLCHASADKPKVRELYRYLKKRGIQPWFDEEDLVGGQDWQVEIPKALATSDAIIICLTKNSVDKEGYIQKEIKFALDKALEMPEGRIFLIPVKFEECEVPFSLSRYQWVDLTIESGYAKMMKALKFRASQLERSTVELSKKDVEEENLAREKKEREAIDRAERERKDKEFREKQDREAREKQKHETDKKEEKPVVVKPKAGGQIVYWFGGFIVLILGIIFLSSLNNPSSTPQPTPENTQMQAIPTLTQEIVVPSATELPNSTSTPISLMEITRENATELTIIKEETWKSIFAVDPLISANIRYSPNGSFLIVSSDSEQYIFDRDTLEIVFHEPISDCSNIFFTSDENYMVVGPDSLYSLSNCEENDIRVYQIIDKTIKHSLTIEAQKGQYILGFYMDERSLLYYFDSYIYWYDFFTGETIRTLDISGVRFFDLSPNGKLFLGIDEMTEKQGIYSIDNMQLLNVLDKDNNCWFGSFSPDGETIFSPGNLNDTKICLWNVSDGNLMHQIDTKYGEVTFSKNGEILASYEGTGWRLWSVNDGALFQEFDVNETMMNTRFSPNGNIFAGLGIDTVYLWDVNSGELITMVKTNDSFYRGDLIFSPDGKTITLVNNSKIEVLGIMP